MLKIAAGDSIETLQSLLEHRTAIPAMQQTISFGRRVLAERWVQVLSGVAGVAARDQIEPVPSAAQRPTEATTEHCTPSATRCAQRKQSSCCRWRTTGCEGKQTPNPYPKPIPQTHTPILILQTHTPNPYPNPDTPNPYPNPDTPILTTLILTTLTLTTLTNTLDCARDSDRNSGPAELLLMLVAGMPCQPTLFGEPRHGQLARACIELLHRVLHPRAAQAD